MNDILFGGYQSLFLLNCLRSKNNAKTSNVLKMFDVIYQT